MPVIGVVTDGRPQQQGQGHRSLSGMPGSDTPAVQRPVRGLVVGFRGRGSVAGRAPERGFRSLTRRASNPTSVRG